MWTKAADSNKTYRVTMQVDLILQGTDEDDVTIRAFETMEILRDHMDPSSTEVIDTKEDANVPAEVKPA